MSTIPDDFNPLAPETFESPHEIYRELRARCPVAHSSAYGGFWALTLYEDVKAAASDPELFISSVRAVVPSDPRGTRRPPLNFDAPLHTPYRAAIDRTLSKQRMDRIAPRIREHAVRELKHLIDRGRGDIALEFGAVYPACVAGEWLNLDPTTVRELGATASEWVQAWRLRDVETVNRTSGWMYDLARSLLADRRREPRPPSDDPASSLLAQRYEGHELDEEQMVGALRQSLVVGLVAPPLLIGGISVHLSRDRELQDELRAHPELLPAALEELLRLYTPYRGFSRTVSRPVELHGRRIEPAEPVTLVYSSANRDERVFENPDEFRLHRPNIAQHLAFGRGPHRCAGMPLARLSLRIALEELLARTSHFEVDGPIEPTLMPELGARSVPLRLTPA
ncbi:MAG: cytochrome P450 [Candidatus Dormibacteraeota bacterium]|nr:cytochrome P450 [Candidatus Dormibacteraeota bacterium]